MGTSVSLSRSSDDISSRRLPMDSPRFAFGFAFVAAVCLLVLGGCDPTVDSFQESELDYSIFGYLNASADTQFVRVEPLRDGMLTRAPERLEADVRLTNLATGRTVSLRDSLFRYLDDTAVHNFYTTADVEPATTYRLRVRGPEGAESHVRPTVPDTFPEPSVIVPVRDLQRMECSDLVYGSPQTIVEVRGMERLVSVRALYHYTEGTTNFGHLADTVQTGNGVVEARVGYLEDVCGDSEPGFPQRIEVVVAASTPEWPEFLGLDLETELLPEVASNVEGGVGFLGGIVTDTVVVYPYERP